MKFLHKRITEETCDLTGYSREELIGEIAFKILFDEVSQPVVQSKKDLRLQGIKDTYEVELLRKDQKKIWIRIKGSPVYDDQGNVAGTL
ncbi:MAG: PAS domain-containing protein [Bacteroidota bacterium]|nr:PAS domain-containing protein [Bacteroidota bacterium]